MDCAVKTKWLAAGLLLAPAILLHAADLTQSTFTEVVRSVDVISEPSETSTPAKVNELFKAPSLVRTGVASRAELTAPDQTLTRVGANTVFSFAPSGREIDLAQGSVLFHSPSGRGGGTIKSGGASAAVSGTTLIVATTPVSNPHDKNGFKVILLEGKGTVTLANGKTRILKAGQMTFVLPNHSDFGPLLNINLNKLVAGSSLVQGFTHALPSLPLVQTAIQKQQVSIASGQVTDTGKPADSFVNTTSTPNNGTLSAPSGGDPTITQMAPTPTETPPQDGQPPSNPFNSVPGTTPTRPLQRQPPFGP